MIPRNSSGMSLWGTCFTLPQLIATEEREVRALPEGNVFVLLYKQFTLISDPFYKLSCIIDLPS